MVEVAVVEMEGTDGEATVMVTRMEEMIDTAGREGRMNDWEMAMGMDIQTREQVTPRRKTEGHFKRLLDPEEAVHHQAPERSNHMLPLTHLHWPKPLHPPPHPPDPLLQEMWLLRRIRS
jgi:hypothetical protein